MSHAVITGIYWHCGWCSVANVYELSSSFVHFYWRDIQQTYVRHWNIQCHVLDIQQTDISQTSDNATCQTHIICHPRCTIQCRNTGSEGPGGGGAHRHATYNKHIHHRHHTQHGRHTIARSSDTNSGSAGILLLCPWLIWSNSCGRAMTETSCNPRSRRLVYIQIY